jgi:hypothetical protein
VPPPAGPESGWDVATGGAGSVGAVAGCTAGTGAGNTASGAGGDGMTKGGGVLAGIGTTAGICVGTTTDEAGGELAGADRVVFGELVVARGTERDGVGTAEATVVVSPVLELS